MVTFEGERGSQWSYDPNAQLGVPGSFGEVFEGTGPDRQPVAVKRIPLPWDSQGERQRREREVDNGKILSAISAQHLMLLLDVGHVGTDLLLVMPRAARSLAAAIQDGALDQAARIEAVQQVARGLAELAQVPMSHRDLKPANVLELGGVWKLADFGISRDLRKSTSPYTFRGQGTAQYKAPEIWAGQPATVKTDLYALGVLAFEVLTGRPPFDDPDDAQLQRQHEQNRPPPLPETVPTMVRRLVLRLLAKEPSQRPQDARAVVETLDNAVRRLESRQEALREAALEAQQRYSVKEAADAELRNKQATLGQQINQALSDLREVLEEATDQAREAVPEVVLDARSGLDLELRCDRSRLLVDIWTQSAPVLEVQADDPLLLAGVLSTAPNGMDPYANIVCELRAGRVLWSALRFEANSHPYRYGPHDRPHGFRWHIFHEQRGHMITSEMNVWRMTQDPLTPEMIVDLLCEAITRS